MPKQRHTLAQGEILFALGVLCLAILVGASVFSIGEVVSYSQIGPKFFPVLISAALGICGIGLLRAALKGGWRTATEAEETGGLLSHIQWGSLALILLGLLATIFMIKQAGFTITVAFLFCCVCYGLGSRHILRDAATGLALTTVLYLVFKHLLGLDLPGGWLTFLLG